MASQFSNFEGSLNVYFIVLAKHGTQENCSDDMLEAFQKCNENDMSPKWILEDACKSLVPGKTDIFIFQEFEGELFNRLRMTKCFRIIGPKCLLHCFLTNEAVPQGTSPVFTTAMKNLVVTVSGFTPERKKEMQQKIEYMGGIYMKQLRLCVTHLVTDSVMSAKYEKATETGIKLYTESWIDSVWTKNQNHFIKATDSTFDHHQCPVFMNLVVTSTGISKREKDNVKKLIVDNGGQFMGQLDGAKVKVLLAEEYTTLSEKMKYALKNNIPCLRLEWVEKSIKENFAMPFCNYLISTGDKNENFSTPNSTHLAQASLNYSRISCIPRDHHRRDNLIEETLSSSINSVSNLIPLYNNGAVSNQKSSEIDQLDMRQVKMAGPFLDGCNIYLTGFTTIQKDKINKILNLGSATRFDDISDALTHVIVGHGNRALPDLKNIQLRGFNPHILDSKWLEESLKLKKPAPEDNFLYEGPKSDLCKGEPPSPLSKKNFEMLKQRKDSLPRPSAPNFNNTERNESKKETLNQEDEGDLMMQYLKPIVPERTLTYIPSRENTHETKSKKDTTISLDARNESEIPFSQTSTTNERFFDGLTFLVTGFDQEENHLVLANINGLGGRIINTNFSGIPDFGVVPLTGAILKHTVNEIITNLWIDDCIDHESMVNVNYYHKPLTIVEDSKPLRECVIAISSYFGPERIYLTNLATALGARHQDTFARKTNPEKGLYGGTHLVCKSPEGNKYNAAVKWKLPAVNKDWLILCAEKLQLIDETPFLVGETMAPDKTLHETSLTEKMQTSLTSQSSNRNILTPKRYLTSTMALETPIINKRLSMVQNGSPNSPFHFATPCTPYGQVFKENPSPGTRKIYGKWIDGLSEKSEEPPKKKIRALSTPLSELRRQLWSAMKNPIGAQRSEIETNVEPIEKSGIFNQHEEGQPSKIAINRQLSFSENGDQTPKKNEIQQQLEEMDKVLRATSSSSTESRFSIHDENGKINHEDRNRENNCNVQATQPESVGWADPHQQSLKTISPNETVSTEIYTNTDPETCSRKTFKFMMSGIKDRIECEKIINDLGGQVSSDMNFDISATHLLCIRPSRNEKMLGSIAAGKWIIHSSYLQGSKLSGRFLDENMYEWGNPQSSKSVPKLGSEIERTLAEAAHRWRVRRQNGDCGAFQQMVATLIVNKDKHEQFARLIEAGGGTVVQAKPPYSSPKEKKITHCFVNTKVGHPVDWAMFASKGILCFLPQFLNLQLTATEIINPREHVIPEFKKYLALLPK